MTTPASTGAVLPLLAREPGDAFALQGGRVVTAGDFLEHAHGLAAALPRTRAVVNLCVDRFAFCVGIGAALARGLTTLLPPNALESTVTELLRGWPGSVVIADGPVAGAARRDVIQVDLARRAAGANPDVPAALTAVVAFTSGSTGDSLPQAKSWAALAAGTALNLRYLLPSDRETHCVVSTMPAQHMYGLETTVLAALRGPVTLACGQPFYPADVAAALEAAPSPRILASTPVHLRALLAAGLRFPPLARILCATAPLEPELARAIEERFGAPLVEIYGCTEAGSMASRRTAAGAPWRFFDGLRPFTREGATWLDVPNLPAAVRLPDALDFDAAGGFALAGRDGDMVKVGGKRASLADITRRVLAIPGVTDAVVFRPDAGDDARLAALVVAPGLDAAVIRAALRPVLDPVFIPRRVLVVPRLPRAATGKLPRAAVLALYREAAG